MNTQVLSHNEIYTSDIVLLGIINIRDNVAVTLTTLEQVYEFSHVDIRKTQIQYSLYSSNPSTIAWQLLQFERCCDDFNRTLRVYFTKQSIYIFAMYSTRII